jgi:hypothetical protein
LIQIYSRWEGPQEVYAEEGVYDKLGLLKEDEREAKAREEACHTRAPIASMNEFADELVCGDQLSDDMVALCDWRNPVMSLDTLYNDMILF